MSPPARMGLAARLRRWLCWPWGLLLLGCLATPLMGAPPPGPAPTPPVSLLGQGRELAHALLGGVPLAVLVAWNLSLRRRVAARTAELLRSEQALSATRRVAEQATAQLHATLDAIPDLLFEMDLEGRYLDCHAARADLLAVPPDQLLGRTVHEVLPAQAARAVIDALHEAAAKGRSTGGPLCLDLPASRHGGSHWFELSVARKRGGPDAGERFIVLSRDISDTRRAEQALARHRDELEQVVHERSRDLVVARDAALEASRAKSEFLSRMSHELRTPLNAIMGFSQLLAMDRTLPARSQEFVQETVNASRHLLELINDVLDLAQVESGRIALNLETLALVDLAGEVLPLMQPLADLRHVAVQAGALQGWAVRADRMRLKQVLVNLLSNAIKYNRSGGGVMLDVAAPDEHSVRLRVSDTGLGIAPEHLPRVFEPFNRFGAGAGAIEGTGIGLSICRRLAEAMGGRIGVASRPDQGSEFWVDLPREHLGPAAPVPADADPAGASPPGRPQPARVLVVEDNPVNMRLMQDMIERHGHLQLLGASSAAAGLELARAQRPDLILLDITLPDMDGYALMARLRAETGTRDIPVVAVTAKAMPSDARRVREAGFDGYLTKPIDLKAFDAVLLQLLSRRQSAEV